MSGMRTTGATTRASREARPEAAPGVPELAGRLRQATTRLARVLRQQGEAGISASAGSALAAVHRAGRITLGDLAAAERVQPPTMTKIVAGLEEAGMVARETDGRDRRVTWVRCTPEGQRQIHRMRSRKNAYLARALGGLDPADVAALEMALPVLERLVEEAE